MSEYAEILKSVVADIGHYYDCSLIDFAKAIRVAIEEESHKEPANTELISLLCNAAKIGWELAMTQQRLSDYILKRNR
jgi:hypothetical protein